MCSGEHDLRYYNLFQIYLKLYEVVFPLFQTFELFINYVIIIVVINSTEYPRELP